MICNYRRITVLCNVLIIAFDHKTALCNVAKYSTPQSDNNDHLESLSRTHSISSLTSTDENESEKNKDTCESYDYCSDKLGYDALKALHQQLDDDANGNIDVAESDEFLRDELHYENGYERQKGFHRNDKYISVDELWQSWVTSEVHNWTVEDTIEWLVSSVELPQYVKNFQENAVDGTTLPRMAVNNAHFLNSVLGIKDPIHKQKIALKAMDVVLFGPPRHHSYVKDVLLVLSLVIAIGGCWFAYVQHKYSQTHMSKMVKDMESLQHAEEALLEIQKELDKANMEREDVVREKQNLEQRLRAEKSFWQSPSSTEPLAVHMSQLNAEGPGFNTDQLKLNELEDKLRNTQEELKRAEKALESKCWVPPSALQHWLQMTHELELKHYNAKKSAAEQQLAAAKEGCEKLRKRRSSFLGAFRIAHGGSIDDVDNRILQAKAALSEVTKDLQERLHRWRQIELLCGFPIVINPGLIHLESLLQRSSCNGTTALQSYSATKSIISNDSDNALTEDELPPSFTSRGSADNVHSIDSLSSIHTPASIFRRPYCVDIHGSILTGSLDHSPVVLPELKHCASSGAILQMTSSATNAEQYVNSKQTEEEVCEDSTPDSIVSSPNLSSGGASGEGNRPNFTLGDSFQDTPPPVNNTHSKRMFKSHSHDNHSAAPREISQILSLSESCLTSVEQNSAAESKPPSTISVGSLKPMGRRKKSSNSSSVLRTSIVDSVLDEEVSSESSAVAEPEVQKEKKKRLFLPNLKKKKAKAS